MHVLNYEMEAATVLTLCSALSLRGGCVTGVIVNRTKAQHITPEDVALGEGNAIQVAVAAMRRLVSP